MNIGESGDTVRPLVRNVKFSSCESEKIEIENFTSGTEQNVSTHFVARNKSSGECQSARE